MDLGLEGRVAIVTGASKGIGKATALRFAMEGAHVVVTYLTDRDGAERVASQVEQLGSEAAIGEFDLRSPSSMRQIADEAVNRWGRVDALVNNAVDFVPYQTAWRGAFEDCADEYWRPLLRANTEGPLVAIQAVLPIMRRHGWGRIVNVSSIAAVEGMQGFGWYSAAKAALHGLTRTLAKEIGPAGVLVNVVMPGATATEGVKQGLDVQLLARHAAALPTRRLPEPDDVAAVVTFLASAANKAITGEVVRASGGRP